MPPRPARPPRLLLLAAPLALLGGAIAAAGETPAAPSPAACGEGMRALGGGRFRLADGSATAQVEPYCLDAVEVTADAYAACVRAGACSGERLGCSNASTFGKAGRGDHPVNCVSWPEADGYCRWQKKRLPTEGEWEWAARGQGRASRYPWGEAAPGRRACWDGTGSALGAGGRSGPCPVGAHPDGDSPDGLHDLAGNVREWTASGDEHERVIRGGSWGDSLDGFLAAGFRGFNHPEERFELTGFRCAAAPAPPPPASERSPAPAGR
jgi:formylglycine-generating enzyme required for sulfatase activity